jgi:hypothetical protein
MNFMLEENENVNAKVNNTNLSESLKPEILATHFIVTNFLLRQLEFDYGRRRRTLCVAFWLFFFLFPLFLSSSIDWWLFIDAIVCAWLIFTFLNISYFFITFYLYRSLFIFSPHFTSIKVKDVVCDKINGLPINSKVAWINIYQVSGACL